MPWRTHHRGVSQKHSAASIEVGRRIAAIRTRAGISARSLAECADMDLTNYQRIERGEGNPTVTTLIQIATALEVDAAALVTGLSADQLKKGHYPYGYTELPQRRRSPRAQY